MVQRHEEAPNSTSLIRTAKTRQTRPFQPALYHTVKAGRAKAAAKFPGQGLTRESRGLLCMARDIQGNGQRIDAGMSRRTFQAFDACFYLR
ncbi:uncharacterized protein DFL_003256 [Arthrobotrys flagrans]|uniref:Uncharacterized protein n=1 Tax=Arthrobotrys flagrans TaxID=97331 RepID=A0A437A0X7_ARTFL|nr:hypothetical protein DFL_003256 [Arthrobotrys flagrans]